jgi:putative transposase
VHFKRQRFPAELIAHAVWLYCRFPLHFPDIEDLLAERGINVSFQTELVRGSNFNVLQLCGYDRK